MAKNSAAGQCSTACWLPVAINPMATAKSSSATIQQKIERLESQKLIVLQKADRLKQGIQATTTRIEQLRTQLS